MVSIKQTGPFYADTLRSRKMILKVTFKADSTTKMLCVCSSICVCALMYSVYHTFLHGCFNSFLSLSLSLEPKCLPNDYSVPHSVPFTCHVLVVQCDRCQPEPAGSTAFLSQHLLVTALREWKHLSGRSVNGALERLGRLSTPLVCHPLSTRLISRHQRTLRWHWPFHCN